MESDNTKPSLPCPRSRLFGSSESVISDSGNELIKTKGSFSGTWLSRALPHEKDDNISGDPFPFYGKGHVRATNVAYIGHVSG